MTTCLEKSCLYDLLCMSGVGVNLRVCFFPFFYFDGGMWDLIVLVPDHCLPFL